MKKTFILLNALILIMLLTTSCFATEFDYTSIPNLNTIGEEVLPINENEQVIETIENPHKDIDAEEGLMLNEDDLYEFQDEINHTGLSIDGNVYLIGESVNIKNSLINGNIFIIAEKLELDNVEIYGSLYLVADTAKLNVTALDVYAACADINIQEESSILRCVRIASDDIRISGNIDKNCYLAGENIDLSSSIILGDLNYTSSKEVDLSRTSVTGKVDFTKQEDTKEIAKKETFFENFSASDMLSTALNTFIIAGIILLVSNKFVNVNRNTNIGTNLGISLIVGAFALVMIPIISIVLMISVIGLGLGMLLLILYILLLLNAISIVSLTIALVVLKNKKDASKWHILGVAVIVSLIINILKSIPAISGLMGFLIIIVGLGIVFKTIFSKTIEEDKTPVQTVESNNA